MGRSPVRTTSRRFTSKLPVVRSAWFSPRLAGAARRAGSWRLLPGVPAPRLRSAVLRRRSATVRTDTAYACAAQEESAPVLVAGDHHLGVGNHRRTGDQRPELGLGSAPRPVPSRMTTTRSRLPIPIRRLSRYPRLTNKPSSGSRTVGCTTRRCRCRCAATPSPST